MAEAPRAKRIAKKLKKHGDTRVDEYFWLRERENKDVVAYIEAENAYVETQMSATQPLQEKLITEMRARIKEDDQSAPVKRGEFYYFFKYLAGAEYLIYCRRRGSLTGPVEELVNVNELAKGHKYYDVGALAVTPHQQMVAYSVDTVGRRFFDIHFKDLASGRELPDVIKDTTGSIVWMNDNRTILYSKQDPQTLRSFQIYRYELGSNQSHLVYEEIDPQFYVSVEKSLSRRTVFITSTSNTANEVRYASADAFNAENMSGGRNEFKFKIFLKREKKHEYAVLDGVDRFFILTNFKAKNFRLMECPLTDTNKSRWREVIAHRPKVLLEEILVLQNHIVVQEREKGLTQIAYFSRAMAKLAKQPAKKYGPHKRLRFPDPSYVAHLGSVGEYDSPTFRYGYESLNQPPTDYDFHFSDQRQLVVKRDEVPTYDSAAYKSERKMARAKDGTLVPISLVYKKSLYKKSQNPLFVIGYGSYGYSYDAHFRSSIVSLLDRGFVFAIAHIRGGSEMGRKWYEDGKLLKKKNTFTDFITCTEYLLKHGFGKKGHAYAMGGSAGGLLMGAVMNMRPDLYRGILAAVPFVDVITTMLDDTIPLTTNEYEEWGNPNDAKFYKYMKSYSPYDNVSRQAYPNLLITTGFHDSQVQYWEPAKWIAKLRTHNTNAESLLLFKTDMSAGHSGTTGRFQTLKEDALEYAFLLMLENMK